MVKLTDRLQMMADQIQPGETIADIGTDHGLLPIFLYESGISPNVILCDINAGPLEMAKANIRRQIETENRKVETTSFQLRQGCGLEPLSPGEVDAVVIAGMGGLLISDILAADVEKTRTYSRLILQPRNHSAELRRWLTSHGFEIYDEMLVKERHFICEILCAAAGAGEGSVEGHCDEYDEVSSHLFVKRDSLLTEFLEHKIHVENKIIGKLMETSLSLADRGAEKRYERMLRAKERKRHFMKLLVQANSEIEFGRDQNG